MPEPSAAHFRDLDLRLQGRRPGPDLVGVATSLELVKNLSDTNRWIDANKAVTP